MSKSRTSKRKSARTAKKRKSTRRKSVTPYKKPADGRRQQAKVSSSEKEATIRVACAWLRTPEGRKSNGQPNLRAAADKFEVPYTTLRDRWKGNHKAAHEAHEGQMLLTIEEERALVEWMKKDAEEGHPWTKVKLKMRVCDLTGREDPPSETWVRSFHERHSDVLHFRTTSGLDPIRAKCFNPTNMEDHFKKFGEIQGQYRIKINIDETGSQLGGGRRNSGRKCYTVRGNKHSKYRQRDGSLELVTVIEACTSDGAMLDPGFIFTSKGGWTTEWWANRENSDIS